MIITSPGKKKKAISFYIFITWFSFFTGTVYAQQKFNVLHFTNDNFLPQNSVEDVAFDKHGYTWLATQFGLVRYDGSHFRIYNTFNTPAIKHNRFSYVANDPKGNIYALDGRSIVMQVTDTGFIERKDLIRFKNCFFFSEFVNYTDLIKNHGRPFKDYELFKKNDSLQTFFYIDSSRFYFTSKKFAGYFDGKIFYTRLVTGQRSGFISGGLLFAFLKNGTFNIYKDSMQLAGGLKIEGDIVRNETFKKWGMASSVFTADADSNAYIFCNHALYSVTGNALHVTTRLVCDSLEVKDCVNTGYNASTGTYYLCSEVDGLYVLEPGYFKSLVIPTIPGNHNINVHYAIIEAGKNKILSANNYVYENETIIPVPLNITSIYSLYSDNNHHLFFQSGPLLYETDTLFHALAKYPLSSTKEVKCISKDVKGVLWVAVVNKLGVLENGTFHFYSNGLTDQYNIESFIIQHDSLIWIATPGGLFLFHIKDHRFEEIKELSGSYVRALKLDDDGTLWIGTYGQGFYRYKDYRLVKFPADKNGYLSLAHCFMEDRNGFFWIPTNHGLFQVKKSDLNDYADGKSKALYYQYYDKTKGFATNEFNGGCVPCGIRISDGSFILPSINGLGKFNPESIHPLLPSGPIFIDKISADTITYSSSAPFKLNPQFRQLVFEVSSVYYGNKNNNNIEYHIKGLSDVWYPLSEDGKITITLLPHGNYILQLRRLSGFGPDNYVRKNISFSVAPEFFETAWFRLLLLLLITILIWFGFRIRYGVLKKQKLALEIQVAQRTTALRQTVQDLELSENALYNIIQQKEKISSILLHDLKSPLRFLTLVSDHIHSQIDHGNKNDLKKLTQDMMNSSRRISMVTDEFLAWLITDNENYMVSKEGVFLKPLADEIAEFFGELVESNHNILDVDVNENLKVIADERVLRAILRNLIDNANKHTRKGRISLKAFSSNSNGVTEIKVCDTGQGMTEEQLKLFSNVDSNSLGFSLHIGNRLGSRIIRDFIHKLGGTLTVTSEPGKGTTITLFLKN